MSQSFFTCLLCHFFPESGYSLKHAICRQYRKSHLSFSEHGSLITYKGSRIVGTNRDSHCAYEIIKETVHFVADQISDTTRNLNHSASKRLYYFNYIQSGSEENVNLWQCSTWCFLLRHLVTSILGTGISSCHWRFPRQSSCRVHVESRRTSSVRAEGHTVRVLNSAKLAAQPFHPLGAVYHPPITASIC